MIIEPIYAECPFPVCDLIWRGVRFATPPDRLLFYQSADSSCRIVLPAALHWAAPKRQVEFLAGRLCAAVALQAIGLPQEVLVRDRAPIWPYPARGSISHSDDYAVAVVSLDYSALGVDCETIMSEDLAECLSPSFLSASELVRCPVELDFNVFATLIFSAKESLYKAVSERVGRFVEFLEVELAGFRLGSLDLIFQGVEYCVLWKTVNEKCFTLVMVKAD